MKMFCFITSVVASIFSILYLIIDFPNFNGIEDIIYFCIQFILVLICITGIIINMPYHKIARKPRKNAKYINLN